MSINLWSMGCPAWPSKSRRARPPKLTATQKDELKRLLVDGPQAGGFSGGCWRAPMIQVLIQQRFGVVYNVFYLAEFLKNLGFSYQKARVRFGSFGRGRTAALVYAHLAADCAAGARQ